MDWEAGPGEPAPPFETQPVDSIPTASPLQAGSAPDPPRNPPNQGLWLFYLFFRPAVFFRHFVLGEAPGLATLAAWIMGIANAIDRLDMRAFQAEVGSRRSPHEWIESWTVFWSFVLVSGAVSGLFYFILGGWWYRVRLGFCGATDVDKDLARRVYLFACQVWAVPAVLYAIWQTEVYATPALSFAGDDGIALIIPGLLLWSLYASYRGVRTAFVVRKWAARAWFLLLPGSLYSVVFVGVITALVIHEGWFESAPRVDQPTHLVRPGFTLDYPSNWDVDTENPDYDADSSFLIEPLLADAYTSFTIFDEPIIPAEEAELTLMGLAEQFDLLSRNPIEQWGNYSGKGYEIRIRTEGSLFVGCIFVATTDARGFEILELCEEGVRETMNPGFELMRRTFRMATNDLP